MSKNTAAESKELNNTLEKLRAMQAQTRPPTAKANPAAGGAPNGGGSPQGDLTSQLSASQKGAIGDKVRECWTKDAGALDVDKMSVAVVVTIDGGGTAHDVNAADADRGKLSDPRFRAFFERARRAILDARCSPLPLPPDKLGGTQKLTFIFKP